LAVVGVAVTLGPRRALAQVDEPERGEASSAPPIRAPAPAPSTAVNGAPRASIARHDLSLSVGASGYTLLFVIPGNALTSVRGASYGASLDYSLFLSPLVDDDMPLSVRQFLQRTPSLDLSLAGSRGGTSIVPGTTTSQSTGGTTASGSGSLGVTLYPHRALRIGARASFSGSTTWTDTPWGPFSTSSLVPSFFVAAGVRGDRWEVSLTYGFHPVWHDGALQAPKLGTFNLEARGLLLDALWLTGSVFNLNWGGVGASGSLEWFFTPTFGLYGGLSISSGQPFYNSTTSYLIVTPHVGLGWWVTPQFEINPVFRYERRTRADQLTASGMLYQAEEQIFGATLVARVRLP
jgi:hypothetical protein